MRVNLARFLFVPLWFLSACAVLHTQPVVRIALLAPFEGRYREVGYEALYAARLALSDSGQTDIELLPVDDGGTSESASDRARALAQDPQLKAVLALGYAATEAETQRAFGDLPVLIVGTWGIESYSPNVLVMENAPLAVLTTPPRIDVVDAARLAVPADDVLICGEVCALRQFVKLRATYGLPLEGVAIATRIDPPDDVFRARYKSSAEFAPEPGLLAVLTYEATQRVLNTTGDIDLLDWYSRPVSYYSYNADGQLLPPR